MRLGGPSPAAMKRRDAGGDFRESTDARRSRKTTVYGLRSCLCEGPLECLAGSINGEWVVRRCVTEDQHRRPGVPMLSEQDVPTMCGRRAGEARVGASKGVS